MHVKEPRTLIVKEMGLAPVFLDSRLEHPSRVDMCARYKTSVLLFLVFKPHLVFLQQLVDTVDVVWDGASIPFLEGVLRLLQPSEELLKELGVVFEVGQSILKSLLSLLVPVHHLEMEKEIRNTEGRYILNNKKRKKKECFF